MLYNTTSMEIDKIDRMYQWDVVTMMMDGCKLVTVNVENT